MTRSCLIPCAAICLLSCLPLTGGAAAQTTGIAVPQVTGPLPVTAASYPFAAADHAMTPFDLAAAGYIEEEFVLRGNANVYGWNAARAVTVLAPNAPYTTRILVRRPRASRAFSGAVIVEPMFTPRRWDWPMMWGYMRDGLVARGDAWVGITMPGAVAGLQKFDAARYRDLSAPA